jgi:TatD DNase family protein
MVTWPPFDLHAHVAANVDATELLALRAVIFAATRSLDEVRSALARPSDPLTVWGVGVHPGIASSLASFDRSLFTLLIATPLTSARLASTAELTPASRRNARCSVRCST